MRMKIAQDNIYIRNFLNNWFTKKRGKICGENFNSQKLKITVKKIRNFFGIKRFCNLYADFHNFKNLKQVVLKKT